MGTITKRTIGGQDALLWDGTVANKTFTATTSTGRSITMRRLGYRPEYDWNVQLGDIITKGPWVDVRAFGASGSSQSTTGSVSAGTKQLTLASAKDFENGQGVRVEGAGIGGADLVATIESGEGTTTLTLDTAASTTVSNANVYHDDTSAIQAAIDSLSSGGIIYVPVGTYLVTSTVSLPSNVLMIGDGATSLLQLASGANCDVINNSNVSGGNSDITITRIGVNGNGTNQSSASYGIRIRGSTGNHCTRINIIECLVRDCYAGGIETEYLDDFIICRNISHSNGKGGSYNGIGMNYGHRNGINALNVTYSNGGNGNGLERDISDPCKSIVYLGNVSYSNTMSGHTFGYAADGVIVADCVAHDNTQNGFVFTGTTGEEIERIAVTGCYAYSNGNHGYRVIYTKNICFENCIAYGNTNIGLYSDGNSTNVSVIGGEYSGQTVYDGIQLNNIVATISSVRCDNNGRDGIRLGSNLTRVVLSNLQCNGNSGLDLTDSAGGIVSSEVIVTHLGTIAAGTDVEVPIFVCSGPNGCAITEWGLVNAADITQDGTDYSTYSLRNRGSNGLSDNLIGSGSTAGFSFTAFEEIHPYATLSTTYKYLSPGDVVSVRKSDSGSGQPATNMTCRLSVVCY